VVAPSTLVAHILRAVTVRSAINGGKVIGTIAATTRTSPTWVPVLSGQDPVAGHVRIRLLVGKTITSGWVPANTVDIADTYSWIEIGLAAKALTVHESGKADRSWKLLAVGSAGSEWPTPVGLFWSEQATKFSNPNTVYGPGPRVELSARGTWSEPLIDIHSWTGQPSANSHGCLRAPDAAVLAVADLPLGSPVLIRP